MNNKMMLAAVLKNYNDDLVIEQVPIPKPKAGEVLVKIIGSGLCSTDLHIKAGKIPTVRLPYIPGHELAGEVIELGEGVGGFDIGQRVIAAIDVTCGICRFCRIGRTNLCRDLTRIGFERNGAHAEYAAVPAEILFKISDKIAPEIAAVIPDAVSCMYHAIEGQGKVRAGDKVCIMGIGGLGMQGIQIAKYFGAEVIATSRQDRKLEVAKKMGADYVINTKKTDLKKEIERITDGEMCDVVFDNIGIEDSVQWGLDICCPGGKVVMVGYVDKEFKVSYHDPVIREKEIIGIRASNRQDLARSIQLVEKGIIDPFVFMTMPLKDINEALKRLAEGRTDGRIVFDTLTGGVY